MTGTVTRVVFVLLTATLGFSIGGGGVASWLAAGISAAVAAGVIVAERALARMEPIRVAGVAVGTLTGLLIAFLGVLTLSRGLGMAGIPAGLTAVLLGLSGAYLGLVLGGRHASLLRETFPSRTESAAAPARASVPSSAPFPGDERPHAKIVDTSVIIDGRIADIVEAGFVEGRLVVPQFVLRELQQVADSSDPLKRARGRKGLDVLKAIQESERVDVEITAKDFPEVKEVDGKLIALAESLGAKVLTNDYNLNKVAQLRGVSVLNVNDLANAVKPVVLPGETLSIQVIKEGKERNQGVGYLDDGTMVVVDEGKRLIGERVDAIVTSVIQTNAGKMIFSMAESDIDETTKPRVARRDGQPSDVRQTP